MGTSSQSQPASHAARPMAAATSAAVAVPRNLSGAERRRTTPSLALVVERPVVIVSNRGPVSFSRGEDGSLVAKRGAGGLVSGIGPVVMGTGATWIAAAISEADREAAAGGVVEAEGFRVHS